jgi:ankyrin repeat protein
MRCLLIILLIFIALPGKVLSQVTSLESQLEMLEETAGDTLGGKPIGGYVADTLTFAGMDTSYFLPGDPEFNLIRAVEFGQFEITKLLVDRGINVNASTYEGVTPLMFAAQNGDTEIMRYLIGQGADVNARPDNDVTALISAARTGYYDAAALLLDSGARVDAKDELGLTSLMHASAYNYPGIVDLLVGAGANMEEGDWFGTRPLMMAAFYNCIEAADVLLRRGADPDGKDIWGFTPLMVAVQHGDYDMAWMLLDRGADPKIRNKGGLFALGIAVMNGNEDLVELLLESGANINQDLNYSTNALSLAEEKGDEEMVAFLLENKARYNRRPEISEIRGGLELNFNGNDFIMGFEAGVSENKYKSFLTTGFLARPSAIRILRPENDTLSYQLWEKRFVWPLTLGKNFQLTGVDNKSAGFRVHLTGALTWGRYRGSSMDVGPNYLLVPGAGIYWRDRYFGISFDYQYMPFRVIGVSNHRFKLTLLGFWDFRPRIRYTRKDISWF